MSGHPSLESRTYPPFLPEDRRALGAFLERHSLTWGEDAAYTVAFFADGAMVGTGSLAGHVIKYLAVEPSLRGEGLAARVVSRLESHAALQGIANPFIFTSPDNAPVFLSLGYRIIGQVPEAVMLLEKGDGMAQWCRALRRTAEERDWSGSGMMSALVMNCNPFTLGHLHLVRTASQASGHVFLFAVSEDASVFPTAVRHRLIREETADLPNVTVVPGAAYLVSRATFPSYFLKGAASQATELHARLDAEIFGRAIAPAIGAAVRYVGTEPYCEVTATYNRVMQEELPRHGIRVVEVPRLAIDGEAVSASAVRRHIREGDWPAALRLVPPHTAAYLTSEEARPVVMNVMRGNGRH